MKAAAAGRLPLIALGALLVNALMFTAIEYMVGNRRIRLTESTHIDIANFIRVSEPSQEVRSRRDASAPEKPATEMQQTIRQLSEASSAGAAVASMSVVLPQIDLSLDVGSNIAVARELTPLVRVPPDYPLGAMNRRLEGYVVVRFTVTETGAVADPEVLRSDPPGIFERAALRAILRWKYQPQIVNGEPTSVVSYAKLTFQLAEEDRQ